MDQIKDCIEYGSVVMEYAVEYRRRKTLGICVHPDGSVEVKAPVEAPLEQIRKHVHRRASWICKQQRYFSSFGIHTPERKYVSGESHLYLGRQYMLRIIDSERNEVHYKGNIIEIECRHRKDARALLLAWYRKRAEIKFEEYATPLIARFNRYQVKPSAIKLKDMATRWGSCTATGQILLNPRLVCAPRICIEYVIIHELCHLVHRNHTKDFYELLTQEMPDWKKWKMKLERLMI
ncbi:M48 family metallopeptidase [Bacteroides sp. ET225]|uniref:M48 family metallopeptidase n=1 Tax=Bacteroides sp. ET225 TaxID=2972461 RepID=UPI0021AC360D|nr:SprT family zinc-dependent metalloprotease [Bacteroides sp. ET225]MCR8919305.1 M48 family metallopeptidase [Bacteroides sp. ET225]